jgi:hypothetical protein
VSTASTLTDFDTVVYVREGCTGRQLACDDDAGGSIQALTSDATTGALAGGDYYIFIDGFSYNTGTADVTITISP